MPKLKFSAEDAYAASDPRDVPAYTFAEAAHYLRIPKATVRNWTIGTVTGAKDDKRPFEPIIALPNPNLKLLSFFNLAEVSVLRFLRNKHISLSDVRQALDYVSAETGWEKPLIQEAFRTDGARLYVERLGELISVADPSQTLIPEVLDTVVSRIDWEDELAARLYPITRTSPARQSPKMVVIDPVRSFGRPIIARLGVTTSVIFERIQAGDSPEEITEEYGATPSDIIEAIRCEAPSAIAA